MEAELGVRVKSCSLINWPGIVVSIIVSGGVLLLIWGTQSPLVYFGVVVPLILVLMLLSIARISVVVYEGGLSLRTLLSNREFLWKDIIDVRLDLQSPKQRSARSGAILIFAILTLWLVALSAAIIEPVMSYWSSKYTLTLRNGSTVRIRGNRSLAALEPDIIKRLIPYLAERTLARLESGESIQLHPTVSYSQEGIYGTKKTGKRRNAPHESFSIPWKDYTGVITEDGWIQITAKQKTIVSLPKDEVSNLIALISIYRTLKQSGSQMARDEVRMSVNMLSGTPQACLHCNESMHLETEGVKKWLVCDSCGWSKLVEDVDVQKSG